jgi:putative ABC transport system substrate-binding protein
MMERRRFIRLLTASGVACPFVVRAQQSSIPLVGFVSSRGSGDSSYVLVAFRQGLAEFGFIEGENVEIEYRWADGHYQQLPVLVAELLVRRPAVLVAVGGEPSALAAKASTSRIPIVFTTGGDPVKSGLVTSMSRPGGNATGISLLTTTTDTKRFELLHKVAPVAVTVGTLINPSYQQSETQTLELQKAARTLGRQLLIVNAKTEAELEAAFATLVREGVGALLTTSDPFLDTQRDRIVAFAAQRRLPAVYQFRDMSWPAG